MAVSQRLRFEVLRRDNHQCRYCGGTPPDVVLTVDHVVPVALGGSDDPSNLVACCKKCNGGKSSVPADAPLVANVAADALRWARAMEVAAQECAASRLVDAERHNQFLARWNAWTSECNGERQTIELPHNWRRSVDQFLTVGLYMDDLHELINVAMQARTNDEWKYFCGCCWRRVREMQERAAEIVQHQEPADSAMSVNIQTRWTQHHIDGYLGAGGEECQLHFSGEADQCAQDTLCRIAARTADVERTLMEEVRSWKTSLLQEQIADAADQAEDYIYG